MFFALIFLLAKIIEALSIKFFSSLIFPGQIYSFRAETAESSNIGKLFSLFIVISLSI